MGWSSSLQGRIREEGEQLVSSVSPMFLSIEQGYVTRGPWSISYPWTGTRSTDECVYLWSLLSMNSFTLSMGDPNRRCWISEDLWAV